MTGNELYRRAMHLLNYTGSNGGTTSQISGELNKVALTAVNQILADVLHASGREWNEIGNLNDNMWMVSDETAARVMPWGVAMLLAQAVGDAENQQLMAAYYNRERGSLPKVNGRRVDTLPYPSL